MRLTKTLLTLPTRASEKFAKYAFYSPTSLSLKNLAAFSNDGDIVESTRFLRFELPVRIANILKEIHLLPKKLLQTPSASLVTHLYEDSFSSLIDFDGKPLTEKICNDYLLYLNAMITRHDTVVETMARGLMEMQQTYNEDTVSNGQIQYFLDRFYMMRISIRMLINQHLLIFSPEFNKYRRFIGCIDPNCDVVEILKDAYNDAKLLCNHHYANSPEIKIELVNDIDSSIKFVYVPSHLYHILFELLKNSMRAVVEKHGTDGAGILPPIEVLIVNGKENVAVKISDRGGGFPRSFLELLFRYTYTTAGTKESSTGFESLSGFSPIAGYGYGLPLSRLYARYFRGDLILSGLEGYGTDAYVFLMRSEADADELLPVFNRTSARHYESTGVQVGDWSHRTYESP